MGAIDLNRIAVCMGKVIKLLSELQPMISNGNDVYEHKEDFCCIAYMCRVGILDRIENNSYMRNPILNIRIPTGIFSSRKETINSGLNLTVGKLKELVSKDIVTENYVEDILNRRGIFYQYEDILPDNFKRSL
ncbi:hypothetical protein [Odoribacter laneus]|uniref:Uncharacterized protein n=1 Tax=Odoribacter laneus YIT 12061 TaxID=742817 RepID=H1DD95_9BACT|nr:hypothetical protein [Odoribacter laneus]EHP50904.1 hypothetical protein HMPREF9449_00231 [Odoribacter laneus YIT 12061]